MKHRASGNPCPQCKGDRWRTTVKGHSYTCRKCGFVLKYKKNGQPYKNKIKK